MIEEKEDPKLISTYKGHKESVLSVAFHPLGYSLHYSENRLSLVPLIPWSVFGISMAKEK